MSYGESTDERHPHRRHLDATDNIGPADEVLVGGIVILKNRDGSTQQRYNSDSQRRHEMKLSIHNQNDSLHRRTTSMTTMTSQRLLVASVFLILLTVQAVSAVPIYIRSGRHNNGNGGSAGSSALQRGTRPPRPGNGSSPHYEIERPHECRVDTIFADCFLCGKIADDIRIYRACCQRDVEIISFCHRLLD